MAMVELAAIRLQAEAKATGQRIGLAWSDGRPDGAPPPAFRLLRRRGRYPQHVDDGLPILDLMGPLWQAADQTLPFKIQSYIERRVYVAGDRSPEAERYEAQLSIFCGKRKTDGDYEQREPQQVLIDYYALTQDVVRQVRVNDLVDINSSYTTQAPWDRIETLELICEPSGGQPQAAGRIEICIGHEDPKHPDEFQWTQLDGACVEGETSVTVEFEAVLNQDTEVFIDELNDSDAGERRRRVDARDLWMESEHVYYYTLFRFDVATGEFLTAPSWRTAAMPTRGHGLDERLYQLLPAIHKQYDEPEAGASEGPLRRFLDVFGLTLDQIRSGAEGLRNRHDIREVHADRLQNLARYIGWTLDRNQDALTQRNEIGFAPQLYKTVGTVPSLCALVNRVTGWECRVKEFARNVFLSNAVEPIRLWEIYERKAGEAGFKPEHVTSTDGFDGRPAVLVNDDGEGWLAFHSDRGGRRAIWLQSLNEPASQPYEAVLHGSNTEHTIAAYTDEAPCLTAVGDEVWMFWTSNRDGHWNIYGLSSSWVNPFQDSPVTDLIEISRHEADDRNPTAVVDTNDNLRVFWQSNRRGPTDIWMRVREQRHDGTYLWSDHERVTTAQYRHEQPAAVLDDNGIISLYLCNNLGAKKNIYVTDNAGDGWSVPAPVTDGTHRDEAPSVVAWVLRSQYLVWHSNRDGHWRIWFNIRTLHGWKTPKPLSSKGTSDKEPVVVFDRSLGTRGRLRWFWRSQERGRYFRSTSIDFGDDETAIQLRNNQGTFDDRLHYSYDTRKSNDDWYDLGTIGLYLRTDTNDQALKEQKLVLLDRFLKQFIPVHVRIVYIIEEVLCPDVVEEMYTGLTDSYSDALTEGVVMRTVEIDDSVEPPAVHYSEHKTVDIEVSPPMKKYRTWPATQDG